MKNSKKRLIKALENGEIDQSSFSIDMGFAERLGFIKSKKLVEESEDYHTEYKLMELEIYVDDMKDTVKGLLKVRGDKINRCSECDSKVKAKLISANPYHVKYSCVNEECDYNYHILD